MSSTLEFFRYYAMAGVYIALAVLAISAVVAAVEKVFGLNTATRPHQRPTVRPNSIDL